MLPAFGYKLGEMEEVWRRGEVAHPFEDRVAFKARVMMRVGGSGRAPGVADLATRIAPHADSGLRQHRHGRVRIQLSIHEGGSVDGGDKRREGLVERPAARLADAYGGRCGGCCAAAREIKTKNDYEKPEEYVSK